MSSVVPLDDGVGAAALGTDSELASGEVDSEFHSSIALFTRTSTTVLRMLALIESTFERVGSASPSVG